MSGSVELVLCQWVCVAHVVVFCVVVVLCMCSCGFECCLGLCALCSVVCVIV